jgi:hypothetical protein
MLSWPPIKAELSRVDRLFREYVPLRRAGGYPAAAAQGGVFAPALLLRAAAVSDRSVGKGAMARGQAPMQPQAQEMLSGKLKWLDDFYSTSPTAEALVDALRRYGRAGAASMATAGE